jgi:hypothetical protein
MASKILIVSRDGVLLVYKVCGLTLARPNCDIYRLDFSPQDQIMGKSQKCFQQKMPICFVNRSIFYREFNECSISFLYQVY